MAAVNEERLQAVEQLQRDLAGTAETVEHPNGLCMATASAKGEIKALHLHPALLQQGPRAVGEGRHRDRAARDQRGGADELQQDGAGTG